MENNSATKRRDLVILMIHIINMNQSPQIIILNREKKAKKQKQTKNPYILYDSIYIKF